MKRKSLLMFVAMLLIFGASARGEKYSNGSYWFDLQKQDVSADEMQQVKARQNAVQNTAADWTEITLPYNVSLAFINGVSINTWGGRAMYFKFTLAQAEIVGFTASTWEPYFEIYKDEAMTNKLLQGSSTYPVLQAGTYYVAVSANENVTAQIAIQNLQLQSVTLSYDGNFSMTSATPLINGGASLAYVFETTAGQLVDFTVTAGQEVTFNLADETGSLVNVTNASYLLGKGKHYVFVRSAYVLGDGETLSGNMKIAPNAYIISELEPLPYQAEFSLTQDNTVRCLDREVQIYSFTLTNVRPARVSWQLDNNSAPAQFYFWDDNGKSLRYSSSSPLYSSSSLPAGKYYMMISDYSEAISKGNTISGNLNLEMLKIYVDWDYFEQLTPEHQILGNNNSMSPAVVQKGTDAIMGRGFSFNAEAGKIYDLKWNAYISDAMNTWMTGISILKNTFTDDYDVDRIMAYSGMYYNTDSGQGSIFFPAKETT
ncbi:MAG: hypothetical protein LBH32_05630, partial [Dysgonamonadaceae bacterium]|nr:hypothetical protein [Dysgonamonadaceae bacterium]